MLHIPYAEIEKGKYYLIYCPNHYISIGKCIGDATADRVDRCFEDCVPFYQKGRRVNTNTNGTIINIAIGEPEDVFTSDWCSDEIFELSEDEIHEHILMETI